MNEKSKSELIIVGGANGSGKTTFAREIVAQTGIEYLGADEIAAQLNPAAPETVAVEAARVFSRRFEEYVNSGESVLVESTLSGISIPLKCVSGALPPELRRADTAFPTRTCAVASDARTKTFGTFIKNRRTNGI